MPTFHTQLFFQYPLNVSAQIGDFVYFTNSVMATNSTTRPGTQFQINSGDINEVGEIVHILSTPTTATIIPATYDPITGFQITPASQSGVTSNNSIVCSINCNNVGGDCQAHLPGIGMLIMFSKDNAANMASILGYYAEVEMVNDSNEKAKLFAVSADVTESSK